MEIGEMIRRERLARGLSQAELADKMKVSQKSVHYWETGKRSPTYYSLKMMAEALNMDIVIRSSPEMP